MSIYAVAGGRSLSASFAPLVSNVCASLVASGSSLSVGCASGCDAFVLSSALSGSFPVSSVRCFSAFSQSGRGVFPGISAFEVVSSFAGAGGSVTWASSDFLRLPPAARLASRTRLVVGAASAGCVVFFASSNSRGSLLACSVALSRGMPVIAFECGLSDGDGLPSLGAGSWVASPLFDGAFAWAPSAGLLF